MMQKKFKPTGLMPRSIPRTVRRFFQQLQPGSEQKALEEFRVSRYQAIVSAQCLLALICLPLLITLPVKSFCIRPVIEDLWNRQNQPLFLNAWQEHRAFLQLQEYTDQRFFDQLLIDSSTTMPWTESPSTRTSEGGLRRRSFEERPTEHVQGVQGVQGSVSHRSLGSLSNLFEEDLQREFLHVAETFNKESMRILTNVMSDLCCFGIFLALYRALKPQRAILKTFVSETLYSFSDTSKAFLVLLMTDLLVGYHSPIGWELSLETLIEHVGFAPNEDFVFLLVATVPVFLSTVFKYGIFRYLNRVSPSTVAIYHNMIE